MNPRLWIAWERQRRSVELARRTKCDLVVLDWRGWSRYPRCILATCGIILRRRPDLLIVQNPSMLLAALACLFRGALGLPLVVDRHTTFMLDNRKRTWLHVAVFRLLHNFTVRHADLTIVTNHFLAELVRKSGGRAFVLPDSLPDLRPSSRPALRGRHTILLVSSFGKDEPVAEAIAAMKVLDRPEIVLYISGNCSRLASAERQGLPENVVLTGFMTEQEFVDMLFSVDVVMALTTSEWCMLCGCYEALAAGKPLITSRTKVLEEYFVNAECVDNSAAGIARGIAKVVGEIPAYGERTRRAREEIAQRWNAQFEELEALLGALSERGRRGRPRVAAAGSVGRE
jgi:glycosyltransferase involved in cell wall biosynthesis